MTPNTIYTGDNVEIINRRLAQEKQAVQLALVDCKLHGLPSV